MIIAPKSEVVKRYPLEHRVSPPPLFAREAMDQLLNRHRASSNGKNAECMAVLYGIYSALQQNFQRSYIGKSKENDMLKAKCYIQIIVCMIITHISNFFNLFEQRIKLQVQVHKVGEKEQW